jgi:hypothetical protein
MPNLEGERAYQTGTSGRHDLRLKWKGRLNYRFKIQWRDRSVLRFEDGESMVKYLSPVP